MYRTDAAIAPSTGPVSEGAAAPPPEPREAEPDRDSSSGTVATAPRPARTAPKRRRLPQYRVLLHNDNVNDMVWVARSIVQVARLAHQVAVTRMLEAHRRGVSLLLVTHQEHAELLEEQFRSKRIHVTIEPEEG
ncbi:MAG: ATP-dependent Clp protease adaptor ClpS [Phycisphaerales bacterium]